MANVRIVTDSLADIPVEVRNELGIAVVPTIVHFGQQSFRDRVDLGADEFYRRLASSPTLPTTSQPPPSAFEEVYRRLAGETRQIVSIHTTAALSGIYNSALAAAQALPDLEIAVIDSQSVTMSLGWIVIVAARAARAGAGSEEIVQIAADAAPRSHIIAMLDTLEYAQKGGRLGRAQALFGTLLNVKPILSMKNGVVEPVENVRTQKRALQRLAEIAFASGPMQEMAVMHAAGLQNAMQLEEILSTSFPKERILIGETGPVLGAHVGPNAVVICWLNKA